jgi:hypothetical protein
MVGSDVENERDMKLTLLREHAVASLQKESSKTRRSKMLLKSDRQDYEKDYDNKPMERFPTHGNSLTNMMIYGSE